VLPWHVEGFIDGYNRLGMDSLALNDLGDIVTQTLYRRETVDRENGRLIAAEQLAVLKNIYSNIMVVGGNDYALGAASHLTDVPTEADFYFIIDREIPFYEIVVHGYIDYCGKPENTREYYDSEKSLLRMLATGAAPHYLWTYRPLLGLEFTRFEKYYSTHYINWIDEAASKYAAYNAIFKDLRGIPITAHEILAKDVTVTEYGHRVKIYVNMSDSAYDAGGAILPAHDYYVEELN